MNKKGFINIALVILVVVLAGVVVYFVLRKPEPNNQPLPLTNNQTPTTSSQTQAPTNIPTTSQAQSANETPATEKDITAQPAYLIAAYSKNEKNYIDVDYVEWLHGNASIQAQVEDGKCVSASECYDYPNGYKRNQNPLVRTFEVSPSASIVVNGEISAEINKLDNTQLPNPYGMNLSITFSKLKDAVSAMATFTTYTPPFKAPKAFVTIDVKSNVVTKISEPYQE
ncbi:MAG TPA: hypothetical protein P5328_02670 [Candidatus Paceibacterota bacterium]|nr:hypothetical protein [Candidatus Paceibacterota bacterium]HRZ34345.1 hypothetical protein [Candidatus Paceibacterota bacterium]